MKIGILGCGSRGRRAKANQRCLLVDFQTRVRPVFQEAVARVRRGDIGAPVLGHVYYHAPRLRVIEAPGASVDELSSAETPSEPGVRSRNYL